MVGKPMMKCVYMMFWNIKIFDYVWDKVISFKVLATSSSLEIFLPFSVNKILSLDLIFSEKNGLTVSQNFPLSVISFSLRFEKYCFFS